MSRQRLCVMAKLIEWRLFQADCPGGQVRKSAYDAGVAAPPAFRVANEPDATGAMALRKTSNERSIHRGARVSGALAVIGSSQGTRPLFQGGVSAALRRSRTRAREGTASVRAAGTSDWQAEETGTRQPTGRMSGMAATPPTFSWSRERDEAVHGQRAVPARLIQTPDLLKSFILEPNRPPPGALGPEIQRASALSGAPRIIVAHRRTLI